MEVVHAGARLPLPQSRKTRALLALLAMADRPLRREKLCEIFWQIPDDPKGALRWSLSKIRALISPDGIVRIQADRNEVRLDGQGLEIDARTLRRAGGQLDSLPEDRLEALARLCRGGFLDDLDLPDAFEFRAWRIAEREELRAIEVRLRRRLLALHAGREGAVAQAFRLVEIAPEQEAHHRALIEALRDAGQGREAEAQRRLSLIQLRDLGVEAGSLGPARAQPAARQAPAAARPARRPTTVPTVVVGGFRNLNTNGGDDYIAEGLADETARALARMPWFLVVKEPLAGTGPQEADYVLSGTLMRAGERLRINYHLLDRDTGHHVLGNRIETGGADILTAQDEIAGRIAAAMEPAIRLAEIEAMRRNPPAELGPYEHYLRGWSLAFGATGMDVPRAMSHFEEALRLDAENAPSAIMLAWLGMQLTANLNPEGMRRCAEQARTALRYASNDGAIIAHAAYVLMFCERDWDTALSLADTAQKLSPYSPQVWFSNGWVYLCCGDPGRALASFDRSLAYTITHPFAYIAETGRANAFLQSGDPGEAVAAARAAIADNPTFHPAWRVLAASLAAGGERDKAAMAAERLRELAPHESIAFVRRWLPYRQPDQLERLSRALAEAGLPES
jgi:DNA-binding SARP family transcriptional activator/Tfp pilus assembly protein PilF